MTTAASRSTEERAIDERERTKREASLESILESAAHYLPAQAPLETFVHHNTLHAFQHLPFHEALAAARAKQLGAATGYLPEAEYRRAYHSGRIAQADLERSLADGLGAHDAVAKAILIQGVAPETRAGLAWRIAEQDAVDDFAKGVSPVARVRIENETTAWLADLLEREGPEAVSQMLVDTDAGDRGARTRSFHEHFGGKPTAKRIERLLAHSPRRLVATALWQACRRAASTTASAARAVEPRAARAWYLRDAIVEVGGGDPNDLVHPILILLSAAFLDRGQSHWSMPDREQGFFTSFCRVLGAGHAVRPSWLRDLGRRIHEDYAHGDLASEAVVDDLLAEIGVKTSHERRTYIERSLLQLPGWAGMFHRLENAPSPSPGAVGVVGRKTVPGRSLARVRLIDFLAVRLVLDVLALREVGRQLGFREGPLVHLRERLTLHPAPEEDVLHSLGASDHERAWPLFLIAQHLGLAAPRIARAAPSILEVLHRLDLPTRLRIWHEAYEATYRNDLLRALDAHLAATLPELAGAKPVYPRFQMITCIDERSEGLRRHFEELAPAHQTFGTAGFFNVAIAYRGIDDPSTFPLCPIVVTPKHEILEEPVSEHASLAKRRVQRRKQLGAIDERVERASKSIVWGPVVTAVLGFLAALPLLATVFAPFLAGRVRSRLASWLVPTPRTRLSTGFTIEEKATRVRDLLVSIGLTSRFSRIVVVCGHDSSSVNNPHFAAYSCGACGGRSGGPNARLLARMANRREVRDALRAPGSSSVGPEVTAIDIPDTTVFIGAVHDTCADRVVLIGLDEMPIELMPELTALQAALDDAARRHAHERCRRFATAPQKASYREAWRHVEARSYDLSQARPELGHASNAACVVGRRVLTRGLFLDRRVFLASYDPALDDELGSTLERILLAVGPVGSGINLEYFFSTTDNEGFGAGTKLPHNVSGLVGVMNGASSDLRTGLPKQMIEIHEPIRLQLVVETSCGTVQKILDRSPSIAELVDNEWVRLIVVDLKNDHAEIWVRAKRAFERWLSDGKQVPVVARSQDWYRGKGPVHLRPARVVARADNDADRPASNGSVP